VKVNTRQAKSNTGNRIAFGVLIILVSLFVLLCISGAFGAVGKTVYPVFVGFFGLADYALCVMGILIGLGITFNFRIKISFGKALMLFALFGLGILALHSYTSSAHILNADYGAYLMNCYNFTNTAGGMLAGIVSYPFMKLMTPVGALAFFCALFFVLAFFAFFPFIKKNVTYTSATKADRNKKSKDAPVKYQSAKEGTPLDRQKEPAITDFSRSAEEGQKLFVVDVEGDPLQKHRKKAKGAEGYNPLYPNAAGGVEDEQRITQPRTDKTVSFSAKGLARDILFGENPDSDSYAKFNAANNPSNALREVGAPFSAVKRSEMRNKLGIDTTQTAVRENFMSRYKQDSLPADSVESVVREYPRSRGSQAEPSARERLYGALSNGAEALGGEELNSEAYSVPTGGVNGVVSGGIANGVGAADFYALKNEQIRLFKENSTAKPLFEATAYSSPTDAGGALPAEDIKREVVKPSKLHRDKQDINATIDAALESVKNKNNSKLKGMQGAVARAIDNQTQSFGKELEAEAYEKPDTSVPASQFDRSGVAGTGESGQYGKDARIPRAFGGTVLGAQGDSASEGKYGGFYNADNQKGGGDEMLKSIRAAAKEAPPLSDFEKQHMHDDALQKRGAYPTNSQSDNARTPRDKSYAKSEQMLRKMENIDVSKERVTQVNIDQAIAQATPKRPYAAPPIKLLKPADPPSMEDEDLEFKKHVLVETLAFFDVYAEVTDIMRGPTFSLYTLKVEMPKGRTIGSIVNLENDIAMKMEEESVRILAPIPGKNAVGIEVPNKHRRIVRLRELLESPSFNLSKSPATFALGKNLYGTDYVCDIKNLPHMLIAGATGAGKSCCINSIIISLLYKASPEDVRLILIDPKRVELSVYAGIPHLLLDEIVCDVDKAIRALNWAIAEMDRRTHYLSDLKYRDIDEYNQDCARLGYEKIPRIVIIVDELADLMAMGKKAVEDSINRIARLARAVGIHLILATQRPSVDVVSGTIKNNLPTRVAFKVTSGPDSRTVLDANGADKLLGNGDLLYMTPKIALPERMQGAFISNSEVKDVVDFIKENNDSEFDSAVKDAIFKEKAEEKTENGKDSATKKTGLPSELFDALRLGMDGGPISISNMQRKLGLGWPKAAKIFDMMDDMGFLVPDDKDPKRKKVAISEDELEQLILANTQEDDE
jgi:DNA segregation ATPase FtsK/SpoIIIE-like protein